MGKKSPNRSRLCGNFYIIIRLFMRLEIAVESGGGIHKRDTPDHKEILAEGTDGEEAHADFLGREEERD